jgi:hypothetical protein
LGQETIFFCISRGERIPRFQFGQSAVYLIPASFHVLPGKKVVIGTYVQIHQFHHFTLLPEIARE